MIEYSGWRRALQTLIDIDIDDPIDRHVGDEVAKLLQPVQDLKLDIDLLSNDEVIRHLRNCGLTGSDYDWYPNDRYASDLVWDSCGYDDMEVFELLSENLMLRDLVSSMLEVRNE